jgi:hypothetical protein
VEPRYDTDCGEKRKVELTCSAFKQSTLTSMREIRGGRRPLVILP